MLGTWEIAKMKKSSLPEKVASGFSEATKNLKGAKYRPVLYCGKQIVAGTNHMIICKQTLSDREGTEHVVAILLHVQEFNHLRGNVTGAFRLAVGGDDAAPTFAEAGKEMGDRLHHAHRVRARTR